MCWSSCIQRAPSLTGANASKQAAGFGRLDLLSLNAFGLRNPWILGDLGALLSFWQPISFNYYKRSPAFVIIIFIQAIVHGVLGARQLQSCSKLVKGCVRGSFRL